MRAILIVRLGAMGDIIHALPVAAALRARFPDARIDWVVDERHLALLELVAAQPLARSFAAMLLLVGLFVSLAGSYFSVSQEGARS